VRFLINGEPTDNRLGAATRGILRVRLHAGGRAAHSSFPELGDSAIDKLLDALMVIRGVALPEDPLLGRTHYTVGLIEGGVAPNVVSPHASAELMFRTVGEPARVRELLSVVESVVSIEHVIDVPAVRLQTLPDSTRLCFRTRPTCRGCRAGACRCSSARARFTSRTRTRSMSRSMNCTTPSSCTSRSPSGFSERSC
jgi:hypothetical protein